MTDYSERMRAIKRESETEKRVRAMDAHEIVDEIHKLEDIRDAAFDLWYRWKETRGEPGKNDPSEDANIFAEWDDLEDRLDPYGARR